MVSSRRNALSSIASMVAKVFFRHRSKIVRSTVVTGMASIMSASSAVRSLDSWTTSPSVRVRFQRGAVISA